MSEPRLSLMLYAGGSNGCDNRIDDLPKEYWGVRTDAAWIYQAGCEESDRSHAVIAASMCVRARAGIWKTEYLPFSTSLDAVIGLTKESMIRIDFCRDLNGTWQASIQRDFEWFESVYMPTMAEALCIALLRFKGIEVEA